MKFTTATSIKSRKKAEVTTALKKVLKLYKNRGFNPKTIIMDGEFKPMKSEISEMGLTLNSTAANEHVPQIESQIRVVKEQARCICHTLPFKFIPLLMIVEMIYMSTMWINAFPPKGGVSTNLSPCNIMTGTQFDYLKHCKWTFGSYGQAYNNPEPTNTMATRAIGTICLGPTGNLQGSYKFLNLRTGSLVTRRSFTPLPMPKEVIDHVNELGEAKQQPELMTFYDRHGRAVGEIADYKITGVPDEDTTPVSTVETPSETVAEVEDTDNGEEIGDEPLFYNVEGKVAPTNVEPADEMDIEPPIFDDDINEFEDPQPDEPIPELTENIVKQDVPKPPMVETVPEFESKTTTDDVPIPTPTPRHLARAYYQTFALGS